jgi:SAM-dependent methyltransferase
MSALPSDYDDDPGRFLSTEEHEHDDVHPYVAARFAAAGAHTVLDVGGGNGRLARLLPRLGMRCLVVDLSPVMLGLAPRPSVRADGARLPVADFSVDAVAALYTLYHYADPLVPIREARRVLRPGGLFAACAPCAAAWSTWLKTPDRRSDSGPLPDRQSRSPRAEAGLPVEERRSPSRSHAGHRGSAGASGLLDCGRLQWPWCFLPRSGSACHHDGQETRPWTGARSFDAAQ